MNVHTLHAGCATHTMTAISKLSRTMIKNTPTSTEINGPIQNRGCSMLAYMSTPFSVSPNTRRNCSKTVGDWSWRRPEPWHMHTAMRSTCDGTSHLLATHRS